MNSDSILDQVRMASPCSARWEDMTGDDRARFCKHCSKHVFNLSAMGRAEAEQLVREKEGRFCGRFHQRRDGRVLTADCTVGRRRKRTRWLRGALGVLALFGFLSAAFASAGNRHGNRPHGPLTQKIDGWIYDAKVKLGIIKPPMLMGAIALPLPAPTPAPTPKSPSK